MKKAVLLSAHTCEFDFRVRRTGRLLRELGLAVTVLCRSGPPLPDSECIDGVRYRRVRLSPVEAAPTDAHHSLRSVTSRFAEFGAFTARVEAMREALRPDVVHVFGLVPLPAGVRLAQRSGTPLIYDCPELERDRAARYVAPLRWYRGALERRLIKRADAVVTVSGGIADELRGRYGIPLPTVFPNAPLHGPDMGADHIRQRLGLADGVPLGVCVGTIGPGRGLEAVVEALPRLPGIHIAIMGPRRGGTFDRLGDLAARLGVVDRVAVLPAVPPESVVDFIRTADFGLAPIEDTSLSYRLALPNKLFQYAFAGLPVGVSNLPEMVAFVRHWGNGETFNIADSADLAEVIARLASAKAHDPADWARKSEAIRAQYGRDSQLAALAAIYHAAGAGLSARDGPTTDAGCGRARRQPG